jgi:phospholipase/carboxylesterase
MTISTVRPLLATLAVVTLALAGGTATSARSASPCAPGVHRLQLGNGRSALMRVGPGDEADKKALILVLHGAGGSARDGLSAFRGGWDARNVVLVAPAARGQTWSLLLGTGDDLPTVDRALTQAFARCTIDPARVGIGGFSDGATYALSLGVANGRLFHAIMALSPGGVHARKRVGKPRIFVAHGTNDHVLPFAQTRNELIPELRHEGYAVTFRTFAGGHSAPAAISHAAVRWFLH